MRACIAPETVKAQIGMGAACADHVKDFLGREQAGAVGDDFGLKHGNRHFGTVFGGECLALEPGFLQQIGRVVGHQAGGNVDAWVVWDPYFAIAQQRYGARALVDTITQPSLASSSYYMANRDFAQKQGALLAEILKTLQQTTHWASANRDELVQLASQDTGLDPEVWRTAYGRANLDLQPISTAHVAQQQQLADSFHVLGIIPRKLQVQEIVWNWQV